MRDPEVRLGRRVRDITGKDLGRVKALYDGAFLVQKGPALLFRKDLVIRGDEVRGVRDGVVVVARDDAALQTLAAGGVPDSWRVPTPPDYPQVAAPGEAHELLEVLAAERARPVTGAATGAEPAGTARAAWAEPDEAEGLAQRPSARDRGSATVHG